MKIIFQAGSDEKPLYKITLEIIHPNHSDMSELQELIAKYMVVHGGLNWSVTKQ